jgi:hypothetical protein
MEKIILGRIYLDHSTGTDLKQIRAELKSNEVCLECNMPSRWFIKLTKAQAIKLAAHINKFYEVK